MTLVDHWPLFGLRITTENVMLRVPTDADLLSLLEVARRGVHDPAVMPFLVPWTDLPSPEFEQSFFRYHWGVRAEFSPLKWRLEFVVERDGQIIGSQGLNGAKYASLRTVESGSWLGREFQGQGIGKEMRRAVLQFAFADLEVLRVTSGAFRDNPASGAVSRATGYEENGTDVHARRGGLVEQQRFVITRERWLETNGDFTAEVSGFDACRSMFGC
jgi:RimJ/RimL family protein N-acetyltransferase